MENYLGYCESFIVHVEDLIRVTDDVLRLSHAPWTVNGQVGQDVFLYNFIRPCIGSMQSP
jgi:hypothetical protein